MLSDPPTARFITADGKPVTSELVGWRNATVMAGHWALHGWGMFVCRGEIVTPIYRSCRAMVPAGLAGF